MDSDKIKAIVGLVNTITQTGDKNFNENPTRNLASTLVINLTAHATKSPTFAIAVIQRLEDEGYNLSILRGDAFEAFRRKFAKHLGKLEEPQLIMVRKISTKLFANAS